MAITVRSLLSKVRPFRKDLTEEDANYAIQETVRKICRQTMYAQDVVSASTVASTATVDLSSLVTTGTVLRVHLIRFLDPQSSQYKVLSAKNFDTINATTLYRNYSEGYPDSWTYKGDSLVELYPTPDAIYTLEVTLSYVPTGEIETIPLPDEAEDAVVAGAIAYLLMLPGVGQNLSLSKDREILFNRESDALKASAMFGQTSRARAVGGRPWH